MARLTQFYTYLYLREDGTVKYVGKGTKRRALEATNHRGLTPKDKNLILLQEHPSEADAFEAEIFLILYYGRIDKGTGCLRNLTDGGEGASGTRPSVETRRKMSETHKRILKENPRPTPSPETRKKISEALRGEKSPRFGKSMGEAFRLKCSEAKKGCVFTPEHRENMSRAKKGRPVPWLPHGRIPGYTHSPETLLKLSEAAKKREAKKGSTRSC